MPALLQNPIVLLLPLPGPEAAREPGDVAVPAVPGVPDHHARAPGAGPGLDHPGGDRGGLHGEGGGQDRSLHGEATGESLVRFPRLSFFFSFFRGSSRFAQPYGGRKTGLAGSPTSVAGFYFCSFLLLAGFLCSSRAWSPLEDFVVSGLVIVKLQPFGGSFSTSCRLNGGI